ncbi:MAG TPA: hypothetical protein VF665_16325, partial [Longimicrobium sp.]
RRALLQDGALALQVQDGLWNAVEPWVPRIPPRDAGGEARAWIVVQAGAPTFAPPAAAPAFELRGVDGWIGPFGQVLLMERGRRVSAVVEPENGVATVRLNTPPGEDAPALEIFAALTLVSALLLGRLCRTLVHAGAILGPDGRAWMLAGGSFSGKSTTCVTLIRAGWNYLADDHLVLGRDQEGGLLLEGWPRRFNLDLGYQDGASRGVRNRVDSQDFGPGQWVRSAPLAGVLFPRVEAGEPTSLRPISAADALSRLMRQSPWLLADAGAAPAILRLLQDAGAAPAYDLRLGADCYRNFDVLLQVLAAAASPSG